MRKLLKLIRNKWHNNLLKDYKEILGNQNKIIQDLKDYKEILGNQNNLIQDLKDYKEILNNQNKIIQDLQENNKNTIINQMWQLFHNTNIDFIYKNKTWLPQYTNYNEFQSDEKVKEYLKNLNSLIKQHNPPYIKAYCEVCKNFTLMSSDYTEGYKSETYLCCGMNGRMRAMYEYITTHFQNNKKVYIQEVVTPAYKAYEKYFGQDNILGSEYLGQDKTCGEFYVSNGNKIMHQDCTKMSFTDNTFDLIISQHVLEHIFDIKKALSELLRILKYNGSIVISIPFFPNFHNSVMLAKQEKNGDITQIIDPPEFHGNPITGNSSLAFWHHGWEFIEIMKDIGFKNVTVHFFNNLYKGYLGLTSIITGIK